MGTAPPLIDPLRAARLTPSAFARYATGGKYGLPRHVAYQERIAVEVAAGRKKRVGVAVPPRHGKSLLWSRYFPAWFLGNFPDKRVILCSYEADFAAQWGRDVRDLLTEHGPSVFGVVVRQDSSAANRWNIDNHQGGMQTAGAGGPILGKGADVLVIDDPIKNYEEAHSETIREKIWNWYRGIAYSRLEPDAAVVIVQQRTHDQDLIGRVIEELHKPGIEAWEIVNFPAIAEENDVLGRKPGEALWPERYAVAYLETTQKVSGSYLWASMWQQRPTPLGGGLFKRQNARRYTIRDGVYRFDDGTYSTIDDGGQAQMPHVFVTCDTATSSKESADQTAVQAWGVSYYGKLVLLDMHMDRIEGPQIMKAIVAMCEKWKTIAWVEENSTSKHLLSFMSEQGIPFRTVTPGSTNKLTRAIPASAGWEQGKIFLPESTAHLDRDWLPSLERQLFQFTGADGGQDDAVDALAYAYRVYLDVFRPEPILDQTGGVAPKREMLPAGWAARAPR